MDPPPDCTPHYIKTNDDYTSPRALVLAKKDESNDDRKSEYLSIASSTKTSGFSSNANAASQSTIAKLPRSADGLPSVRSSAVVTYSAAKNNAMYSTLAPETNLNLAPSNWLRKTVGLRPETLLPGGRYAGNPNRAFGGFSMASSHLNAVGKVDVVSDAENIKKLLKMPYSKAHVSMAIHRIGRTLLLENFDIRKYTAEESEWEWFRNFYRELVQQGSGHLLKKKSPSSQYDRLMLSKFLYYSIYQDKYGNKIEVNTDDDSSESGNSSFDHGLSDAKLVEVLNDKSMGDGKLGDDESRIEELPSRSPSPFPSNGSTVDDDPNADTNAVVTSEKRWRYWTPHDFHPTMEASETFERNISWTFEDLQMLLGTNMPIFGGGKYPAVSLRLRDSNKPINILTGIDYWLDNLICNVPELVMCFHVNGIVQNYEVIKTEDIPHLEHSSFSPQVVKDIAQNILSFLKSNCTKEGHTYWLFKGSGDDVVKLYDLTTLCNSANGESSGTKSPDLQQNPYIFSVAMLLYKTAINLMQSNDTCDHHNTVKKLLGNCINLLDHTKYQYVVSSAICMLSTLYLPDPGLDVPTGKKDEIAPPNDEGPAKVLTDRKDCDTCTSHHNAGSADSKAKNSGISDNGTAEVASIPHVRDLSIPERYQKVSVSLDLIKSPPCKGRKKKEEAKQQAGQIEENCNNALSYIVSGLKVLSQDAAQLKAWQEAMLQQLFRNAALAYFRLAEQASNLGKLGRALKRTRLALESYETYQSLSKVTVPETSAGRSLGRSESRMTPPDFHLLLPRLLSLCGEIQFAIVQDIRAKGVVCAAHQEEYTSLTSDDEEIKETMGRITHVGRFVDLTRMTSEAERTLGTCLKCYDTALDAMKSCGDEDMKQHVAATNITNSRSGSKDGKRKQKRNEKPPTSSGNDQTRVFEAVHSLKTMLFRRHGHVANEIGASALNRAVALLNSKEQGDLLQKCNDAWSCANSNFDAAYRSFVKVDDVVNQALVLSNMGRLMRVSAQFYTSSEEGQFSKQERHYFTQAIEKYTKALMLLSPKDERRGSLSGSETSHDTYAAVFDNISWELSSCYFSMAQIIQDNAPRDQKASDEAEKEVVSLLNKSLKYCQDVWDKIPKQTLALYRQSKIHYRMASLHHNAYKQGTDSHRCKQLRNLADKHYTKALSLLEGLENPNELIRVNLERLAMKDYYITTLTSSSKKVKVLMEGLTVMGSCVKPLEMIEKSTQVATKDRFSSRVDARDQSLNSSCDVDVAGIVESSGLLRILALILQSFLLSLVKITSSTNAAATETHALTARKGGKPNTSTKATQAVYKELYSRTLRALQPLKPNEDDEQANQRAQEEGAGKRLQENVSVVISVLNDVIATVAK